MSLLIANIYVAQKNRIDAGNNLECIQTFVQWSSSMIAELIQINLSFTY